MRNAPQYKSEDRNASNFLSLSLKHAIENLEYLQGLYRKHTEAEMQLSKELTLIHRCVWTSLVMEIRKLFGSSFEKYKNHSLREIYFFHQEPYKKIISSVHCNQIVQSIISTSNTLISHLGPKKKSISAKDICASDLKTQLEKLKDPLEAYAKYARTNDSDPQIH